jgi:hypothetical protein
LIASTMRRIAAMEKVMISQPLESGGPTSNPGQTPVRRTSPLLVAAAWAVVGLPAAWGIWMTVLTSIQLFHPTAAPPASGIPAHTTAPSK